MAKATNAMHPPYRVAECWNRTWFPWSGKMPNAGYQRCLLCNSAKVDHKVALRDDFTEIDAIRAARSARTESVKA